MRISSENLKDLHVIYSNIQVRLSIFRNM